MLFRSEIKENSHIQELFFIDLALLFEMGWNKYCDMVITADVDEEIQKNRVMERDNVSAEIMPCGTISVTVCSEVENMATIMKEINSRYQFDVSKVNSVQRLDGYTPIIFFDFADYVTKLCPDNVLLDRFYTQLERTAPPMYSMHTKTYYSMSRGQVDIDTYSGVTISDPSQNAKANTKIETAWYKATH